MLVKIAIENGRWNSEFSCTKMVIFNSYVKVYRGYWWKGLLECKADWFKNWACGHMCWFAYSNLHTQMQVESWKKQSHGSQSAGVFIRIYKSFSYDFPLKINIYSSFSFHFPLKVAFLPTDIPVLLGTYPWLEGHGGGLHWHWSLSQVAVKSWYEKLSRQETPNSVGGKKDTRLVVVMVMMVMMVMMMFGEQSIMFDRHMFEGFLKVFWFFLNVFNVYHARVVNICLMYVYIYIYNVHIFPGYVDLRWYMFYIYMFLLMYISWMLPSGKSTVTMKITNFSGN